MNGKMGIQGFRLSVTTDADQDIISILGDADTRIRIHGWKLTSEAVTATLMKVNFHRISAIGSGGSASSTEELLDEKVASALEASVRTLDTTPGTDAGGIAEYNWEQLSTLGEIYTPEMRPISLAGEGFALSMDAALAGTAEIAGFICWEEL